jgi:phospholipid:diacylglycerol acyltransferase
VLIFLLLLVILAAPLLGATETIEATLSGFTFGLPVSEVTF